MANSTASRYLLMTKYKTDAHFLGSLESALCRPRPTDADFPRVVYRSTDNNDLHDLIEIIALQRLSDCETPCSDGAGVHFDETIRPFLSHDARREILKLRDVVKAPLSVLPTASNLQVRYIEVPPYLLDEYHEWRGKTIFANVRKRPEITAFVAYHSILSMHPGVSFFVEFDGARAAYEAGFKSPEYQAIVKQAGSRYIVGGSGSLHTAFYKRLYLALGASGADANSPMSVNA